MKRSFQELLNENETPVLVDFHATWCGPCKVMNPVVQETAEHFGDRLTVIKVDVDKNQAAAMKYQVRGVPTFVLFYKGQELWRKSGAMPAQSFQQAIGQAIEQSTAS